MKYLVALVCAVCIYTNCGENEVRYWTHMYGFAKLKSNGSGINGLTLKIGDIDPENTHLIRVRETVTAHSPDSLHGYFEMDSVCYATSSAQGSQIVWIMIDSTDNPGYHSQYQYVDLSGPTDTIDYYITP
jgi:hypothetical protein